jgi:glycosyltransferase involved in cell wall biosynthesis
MKYSLASQFQACTAALANSRPLDAQRLLISMDVDALSPSSAALHHRLSRMVSLAINSIDQNPRASAASQTLQGQSSSLYWRDLQGQSLSLHSCDRDDPLPGVSLVSACMNRQHNLLKVLPSWLASDADEIIVVDWSSAEEVSPMLDHIDDPRLHVVRIDGEKNWILTNAFNVGLRLARHEVVFKLDADIQISPNFLARNRFGSGEFVRGFWKSAFDHGQEDQKYLNGSFGALKADLRALGYYDERIRTYGWDDSDLYGRLSHLGLAGRLLAYGSLVHLHQAEASRLESQSISRNSFFGWFGPTEVENAVNKYHTAISLDWGQSDPAQDYELCVESCRLQRGRRTSRLEPHAISERELATVLGVRQLLAWHGKPLPASIAPLRSSLELARLLKQAYEGGCGQDLISALDRGKRLFLLEADTEALRQLAEKTIEVISSHHASAAEVIVVLTDEGYRPSTAPQSCKSVLRASKTLVDMLAKALGAIERQDLNKLEEELTSDARTGCIKWVLSAQTLASSALEHAQTITGNLSKRFREAEAPISNTTLVTSVYDEGNLIRLLEYLACTALNLQSFGHLIFMYEVRNGLFQQVMQAMCRDLHIAPGRLSLLPCDHRPTFAELFSIQTLLPDGTLLVVANADVAFDSTLGDLARAALDEHVYVLSRWDLAGDGENANLIRLDSGVPNVFSADAWIVRTPFHPDFRLDYAIGSFHCDSFINNQISHSRKFSWSNPCLDVHAFHLHDSRFNSSTEKHVRDRAEIESRFGEETARNGGGDPLRGAPWSHLSQSAFASSSEFLTKWRPKALVLNTLAHGIDLSTLLWLEVLRPLVEGDAQLALVLSMREADSHGAAGQLIARYKHHFGLTGLIFQIDDRIFDEDWSPPPTVLHRHCDVMQLLDHLQQGSKDLFDAELARLLDWPLDKLEGMLLRVELPPAHPQAQTDQLLQVLRTRLPKQFERLQDFIRSLDWWTDDCKILQPILGDLKLPPPPAPAVEDVNHPEVSIASSILTGSDQQLVLPRLERAPIVLMVSLYEDRAETRKREMIRCLRINSQIFDKIIVLYEQPASTGTELEISIADELERLSDFSKCDKQLADIQIVTIHERPAYRDFFKLSSSLATDGQKPWFVIANSDIAFDRSIERIHELDNPNDVLVWLSRWDKCSESSIDEPSEAYLDPEGAKWALIESTINGSPVPNYLSADAWIYKNQPDDWDEYTYKIGTYFCDSFFANRAFRSGRPVINPCRSIRCFHYHDETINSSAQKFEDKDKIELLHSEERERLAGDDPVAGAQWSTLESCSSPYFKPKPYRWNSEGGLWLRLGYVVNVASTLIIIEAALKATETSRQDIFISVLRDERYDDFTTVLFEFADYLNNPRLFIDLQNGTHDPSSPTPERHTPLLANSSACYSNWEQIAELITAYVASTPNAHHSDQTHLELLHLLTIDELYTVIFLSARHPERFSQYALEASYVAQFAGSRQESKSDTAPKFSLISSLFRAKKYLPRLLENYEAIATLGPCELVIVDVNSDGTDRRIVETFIDRSDYGHMIQYIQLEEDPGIYGCWMKGISMARSPLVSNFNADDRRSAVHPHLLADYLETHSDVDVCFTALKPTRVANLSWYQHAENETWFHWFEEGRRFTLDDFIAERDGIYCSQNIAHCMPMWRKSLHDELGPIREDKYGTSADWAFWLECIKQGKLLALASCNPLGLYFINAASHNRTNDMSGDLENLILYDFYGLKQSCFIQQ